MTAAIVPFPSRHERRIDEVLEAYKRRETRRRIAETRELKAESEALRRDYEERQRRIEKLMQRIGADVERA